MPILQSTISPSRATPFWWATAPLAERPQRPLPKEVDVVVVGSGFTGLSAALPLARAGRSVLVIEAERTGEGASTRNGGIITDQLKPSLSELTRTYGADQAKTLVREGQQSIRYLRDFIRNESIDCALTETGRLRGALTKPQLDAMCRSFEAIDKAVGCSFRVVMAGDMPREIGTEKYVGGVILPDLFSLHPARYHQGLLARAEAAGVDVHDRTRFLKGDRTGPTRLTVTTDRGQVLAGELVLATNGYTGKSSPWLHRRIVPVRSYMMATEPLPETVMRRLFPTNRTVVDTNNLLVYYRTAPDFDRILFGGRPHYTNVDPWRAAQKLRRYLVELFPDLAHCRIDYAWSGNIAYSFDKLPHLGRTADYHYAAGYCGSGVALSSYLGHKLGLQVMGDPQAQSAFAAIPHKTFPFYSGTPWFLPLVQAWYQGRDFIGR